MTSIREGKRKEGNIIPANVPELKQAGASCFPTCMARRQERIAAFFASTRNRKKTLADLPTWPKSFNMYRAAALQEHSHGLAPGRSISSVHFAGMLVAEAVVEAGLCHPSQP